MLQVATRKPTRHSRDFRCASVRLAVDSCSRFTDPPASFTWYACCSTDGPNCSRGLAAKGSYEEHQCSCFTQRLIHGGNMSLIRCAILISTSFAFLAWSPSKGFSDVPTSLIALSEGGEPEDEGDDDDGFLAARVAQGFALATVPLATQGKTREELNQIGYGSYIVHAISACRDCHSTEGHFSGGRAFNLGPRGVVYARNLTPDPATGLQLTESQFIEVLRTGKDFRPGA